VTDNEALIVCARDAVSELLHRCQDLGLHEEELLAVRRLVEELVTFKDSQQQQSVKELVQLLDQPGRTLDRPLS